MLQLNCKRGTLNVKSSCSRLFCYHLPVLHEPTALGLEGFAEQPAQTLPAARHLTNQSKKIKQKE
jgi:hypothetical protein